MSQDQAIFVGTVDADGGIHFDFPKQQLGYCKAKLAGQCVDVIIAPQGQMKSRLQECGFHAMITPWARDEGHAIDDLKRDILRAVFGQKEHTNPITGEIEMVLREPNTSKLNRAQYSELIERTLDIAAECGVILMAPDEYKRRKERETRKKTKEAVSA
jgi:hypothetical protein